jgi:HlyD family secretion protein
MRNWLASALMLCAGGCTGPGEEIKPFSTEAITIGPLVDSVLATGRIHTVTSIDVSSQLSGRIDEVYVDFNDHVDEGTPLARLDPQRFQSRVEELTAALAVARAELLASEAVVAGVQAKSDEDQRNYERMTNLSARGSASDSEVTRARATMLQSASELQTATASKAIKTANIAAAEASLHQAQIDLDRTVIRAPIAGVVIKRSIEPGQTVAVSLSAPELFTIADDLSRIEVHARVDEADVGKVETGQAVFFSVDAHPGRRFDGVVAQIRKAPEISQNVVSYVVVIEASNPGELMLPGMTALVEIVTARKDAVLRVPNAALRFDMPAVRQPAGGEQPDATTPGVWVQRGASQEWIPIELGYSDGEYSEVLSGHLVAEDSVITGYQR